MYVGGFSVRGPRGGQRRAHPGSSLDTVVLVSKFLVVEAKLIHEGGRHLLDLVLGESLAGRVTQGRPQPEAAPRKPTGASRFLPT